MTRSELINEVEAQGERWYAAMHWCSDKSCQCCRENAAEMARFKANIDKLREKLGVKI